ncbi:MAG: penicillin-binding protein 1C [Cyclobacteriaceae bacterium]|jgi:penicillin-binding protein 1C|nr:penicillin-binding protein 1C [Cyclobacteriaceae bacterium]
MILFAYSYRVVSKRMTLPRKNKKRLTIAFCLWVVFGVWFSVLLPDPLFNTSYSRVLKSREGKLLAASVSTDGQWRFPATLKLPRKFETCIITFEDKRFYHHPGIDVLAFARAMRNNVSAGEIVNGGSTLTMQVARMARGNKPRTFWQKSMELLWALRIEIRYSKKEILQLYAAHAPFGGNVVGLEAACWRYFGRTAEDLSWAEAATLAVLPNAPSLLHPGKNRDALLAKRNLLLEKLQINGLLTTEDYQLAIKEPLPELVQALPRHARHLLTNNIAAQGDTTSLVYAWQLRLEELVQQHHENLESKKINHVAAIIIGVDNGEILAYAGNVDAYNQVPNTEVDVVKANRSTGSILKPFLFAAALQEGKISTTSLLPDVPTYIYGFAPRNFNRQFDGAVPAGEALIRSLNVPAVYLLQQYRYEKFYTLLKEVGITSLTQPPDHYGLSMILGGAEGSILEIGGAYASMARVLNRYNLRLGRNKYNTADWHSPIIIPQSDTLSLGTAQRGYLQASAIYHTLQQLTQVYRPGEETGWRNFFNTKKIAWKTGTSFGFRDGWAIGVTSAYVVAVWVGNAEGEGRPGLTGTEAASPLLFSIFDFLPDAPWFKEPTEEQSQYILCSKSGFLAGVHCPEKDTTRLPSANSVFPLCKNHTAITLDKHGKYRVNSSCYATSEMITKSYFVLPPVQAYYYNRKSSLHATLPAWLPGCAFDQHVQDIDMVYPKNKTKVFLPRDLTGKLSELIMEAAHLKEDAIVYWHIDGDYLGKTQTTHKMPIQPVPGKHKLSLIDELGQNLEVEFEISRGYN